MFNLFIRKANDMYMEVGITADTDFNATPLSPYIEQLH